MRLYSVLLTSESEFISLVLSYRYGAFQPCNISLKFFYKPLARRKQRIGQISGGKPALVSKATTRRRVMSPAIGVKAKEEDQPHILNLR